MTGARVLGIRLWVAVAVAVLAFGPFGSHGAAWAASIGGPHFDALSDNGKKIAVETGKIYGDELEPACKSGRRKLAKEIRQVTKDLTKKGELTGSAGFFQIEVENFFARSCGRKMRR